MDEQKRCRQAADAAIGLVAEELRPWMEERLAAWPEERGGRVAPYDPSYLAQVLLDRWFIEFSRPMGADVHIYIHDYRTFRNQWAHHVPIDEEATTWGLRACRALLVAIGSARLAELEAIERSITYRPPVVVRSTKQIHRRMRDPVFREEQWEHRFDPHVAPVNDLVDELIEDGPGGWVPYIPPYHGGIDSEILLLYQDPGKMTSTDFGGSGFLGCENDDRTALVAAECLDEAGVALSRVTPWNAYPWFLPDQRPLSKAMLTDGLEPLRRLLSSMPRVHTVVTGGKKAHESWRGFSDRHPERAAAFRHLETFHTSPQGIVNGGQQTKAEGVAHVVETFRSAAEPQG